ncbi:hypothetical protein ACX84U_26750, partial [Burkholderia pseudomallei]
MTIGALDRLPRRIAHRIGAVGASVGTGRRIDKHIDQPIDQRSMRHARAMRRAGRIAWRERQARTRESAPIRASYAAPGRRERRRRLRPIDYPMPITDSPPRRRAASRRPRRP